MVFKKVLIFFTLCICFLPGETCCQSDGWYTEGDFEPTKRIKVILTNPLNINRTDCPVVIAREQLPDQNIPRIWITVVDPSLPPNTVEPTQEQLQEMGAYLIRKETHGHFLEYQQDDIDKDGLWDELFFMVDIKADETKTVCLYVGATERGLYEHKTHAAIGCYARHIMPFWEAEYIGWKLYYPTDVDMHGKREPMLTAYPEYQRNLGGYYMPTEYGADIMSVATTFGAGGVCLFEFPALPDSVSRPRFSPYSGKGPIYDTRYAYDVVANGPLRSIIRVKTMNWKTGSGEYELEQLYTAYAYKSYSTCRVSFTRFFSEKSSVMFGCGIREIMGEYDTYQKGGTVVSFGKDFNPYPPVPGGSSMVSYKDMKVDFEGIALVVRDVYNPEYINIKGFGGNHTFGIPVTPDHSYEYMIAGGWSEGAVNNTEEEFKSYVITEAQKYNYPLKISVESVEEK